MWLCGFLLVFLSFGCQREEPKSTESPAQPAPEVEPNLPKIVAFGNSLTAGLGLSADEAYPAQLQKLLTQDQYKYEVVNAGVSGDTSSGGLRRIDWSLQDDARFLILELGANDMLRGQPISLVHQNLAEIIQKCQAKKVTVLIAAMEAPSNAGVEYRKQVHDLYPQLAEEYKLPLIPFFLKPVFTTPGALQEDGTHPTAKGARIVAEAVYAVLKPLLK